MEELLCKEFFNPDKTCETRLLSFRFTTISKENFGEKDLREFAETILSSGKARITVDDGVVTIEADEINLTGDIFINGEPVS